MRSVVKTQVNAGSTSWVKLDTKANPFNVGFGCVVTSGTPTYKVEHTFDDVDVAVTPTAFDHISVTGQTINKDGNYAFPVAAVRLTVTSGTGTVTMTTIQAGSGG